jgi:hypothetical protein
MLTEGQKDARCCPLLEAAMGGTAGADPCFLQGIPLAARAQHKEDGNHGLAIINPRAVTSKRMRLPRGEQGLDALP